MVFPKRTCRWHPPGMTLCRCARQGSGTETTVEQTLIRGLVTVFRRATPIGGQSSKPFDSLLPSQAASCSSTWSGAPTSRPRSSSPPTWRSANGHGLPSLSLNGLNLSIAHRDPGADRRRTAAPIHTMALNMLPLLTKVRPQNKDLRCRSVSGSRVYSHADNLLW